ncbi:hypothetical protein UY3_16167 [Chelonia mydas]|uniref:Uncharacterized protein n=1 Tax=Chelonia mydas TaxID=8469 RepID=M7BEX8_CHEMY|nr:hypothetical protein UY3_16167 [Chelonia mydas]
MARQRLSFLLRVQPRTGLARAAPVPASGNNHRAGPKEGAPGPLPPGRHNAPAPQIFPNHSDPCPPPHSTTSHPESLTTTPSPSHNHSDPYTTQPPRAPRNQGHPAPKYPPRAQHRTQQNHPKSNTTQPPRAPRNQ